MKHANLEQECIKLVEAVEKAWRNSFASHDIEVPVSVVAALSLLQPRDDNERNFAEKTIREMPVDEFSNFMRVQWSFYVNERPDLVNRVWPLMKPWFDEERPMDMHIAQAAKRVAEASVRYGQLEITGSSFRYNVDLLGQMLMAVRGQSGQSARGQFMTPAAVCDLMAKLNPVNEGQSILEPAAGTGGLFRSNALEMRERKKDPMKVHWEAVDTDAVAMACMAVNVHLWGLGYSVLLGVGNGLSNEWRVRALGERQETLQLVDDIRRLRRFQFVLSGQAVERVEQEVDLQRSKFPVDDDRPALTVVEPTPSASRSRSRRRGKVDPDQQAFDFESIEDAKDPSKQVPYTRVLRPRTADKKLEQPGLFDFGI